MIQFGNSSVADIKFGSRQISKVYRGADLIWEKSGDWIDVRIGGGAADPGARDEYPGTAQPVGSGLPPADGGGDQ